MRVARYHFIFVLTTHIVVLHLFIVSIQCEMSAVTKHLYSLHRNGHCGHHCVCVQCLLVNKANKYFTSDTLKPVSCDFLQKLDFFIHTTNQLSVISINPRGGVLDLCR